MGLLEKSLWCFILPYCGLTLLCQDKTLVSWTQSALLPFLHEFIFGHKLYSCMPFSCHVKVVFLNAPEEA